MNYLERIMIEKNISQTELHRRSGVSQSHISGLIRGEKQATIPVAQKIASALDVTVGELLGEPIRKNSPLVLN